LLLLLLLWWWWKDLLESEQHIWRLVRKQKWSRRVKNRDFEILWQSLRYFGVDTRELKKFEYDESKNFHISLGIFIDKRYSVERFHYNVDNECRTLKILSYCISHFARHNPEEYICKIKLYYLNCTFSKIKISSFKYGTYPVLCTCCLPQWREQVNWDCMIQTKIADYASVNRKRGTRRGRGKGWKAKSKKRKKQEVENT